MVFVVALQRGSRRIHARLVVLHRRGYMDQAHDDLGFSLVSQGLEEGVGLLSVGIHGHTKLLRQHDDLRALGREPFHFDGIITKQPRGFRTLSRHAHVGGLVGRDESDGDAAGWLG